MDVALSILAAGIWAEVGFLVGREYQRRQDAKRRQAERAARDVAWFYYLKAALAAAGTSPEQLLPILVQANADVAESRAIAGAER